MKRLSEDLQGSDERKFEAADLCGPDRRSISKLLQSF